ncbi:MAG TPA: methyltransferase domain-containing protein [Rudaea sp.]|jgi:predicted methyltransferase|nr:methyltransferase domain-containing protein [Rudaea sp.]
MNTSMRRCNFFVALLLGICVAGPASAADIYDDAVAHPGRSSDDHKRDPIDRPADVLRLSGIKPGMQVADFLAADGYYSELLSYVVGDTGHVLLLNNVPYDKFVKDAWKQRIEKQHLANVEHRTVDPANMGLKDASLDAIVMVKVYHDLYWVDPGNWEKIDVPRVLDQLARALKPGGILVVVDHSAKSGSGSSAATPLHRIDEAFMRKDFESRGFTVVAKSNILRKPTDKLDKISYQEPMLGKTDRFVYVFRKEVGAH